ncbi:MAG: DUF2804 domain-containing protein [Promethearchaeota archaeon]
MQIEITEPSELLDENGYLIQKGWARKLLMNYNRENIKAGSLRIKEWDYYAILNPKFGVAFTVADLGFAGLIACTFLDFEKKTFISDEVMTFFTKGRFNLPRTSEEGNIILREKGVSVFFEKKPDSRVLKVDFPKFNKKQGLEADIILKQDPNMDTIVIATPWKEDPTRFYYNQKINCMPAKGYVKIGNKSHIFMEEDSMGVLDWGRGVWTRKNRWYWSSLSGRLEDGTPIGWNLGYGFSDRSYASENIVFYNGKGHKLDQIKFHFDKKDYLKPWKFTSNDGRFEMIMNPILDRNSKVNLLIIKSIQHQVFGLFSGYFILDDGTKIEIKDMIGFAEDVFNKW